MNITQALGKSIAHKGDLVRTQTGDIGTIAGLPNYRNAIYHRLITVPGSLAHRPGYGAGIKQYQNAPCSFALQQEMATKIKEQIKQDPRTKKIQSVSMNNTDTFSEQTVINILVVPVGYTDAIKMTFTPFSGGGGL